jgi:hypothetical protein
VQHIPKSGNRQTQSSNLASNTKATYRATLGLKHTRCLMEHLRTAQVEELDQLVRFEMYAMSYWMDRQFTTARLEQYVVADEGVGREVWVVSRTVPLDCVVCGGMGI